MSSLGSKECDHSAEKEVYRALFERRTIPHQMVADVVRCPECGTVDLLRMMRNEAEMDFSTPPVSWAEGAYYEYFHLAVRYNTLDVIRFLVEECGADVNKRDFLTVSPIHEAAKRRDGEPIVEYLVSKGANLHVYTSNGEGPGVTAITHNNSGVLRRMCELGLNVRGTAHSKDGETPASFGIRGLGKVSCLHVLYKFGADVRHFYSDKQNTSIEQARNEEVRRFLAWAVFDEFCTKGREMPPQTMVRPGFSGFRVGRLYPWKPILKGLLKRVIRMYKRTWENVEPLPLPLDVLRVIVGFLPPYEKAVDFLLEKCVVQKFICTDPRFKFPEFHDHYPSLTSKINMYRKK